jgi:tRNA/rRNA methyltransferase
MDQTTPLNSPPAIQPPCVILCEPQLAENIGAAARAMLNFGLTELRLVRPRDGWPQSRAWASASGAEIPLDGARVFERIEDALADLQYVIATTARPREALLPVLTPRDAAAGLAARAQTERTGILFGGERAGLATADIALCHAIVTLPVSPLHTSLNLAQAVAVTAYEWRLTQDDRPPARFVPAPPPATGEALLGFYEQLEAELDKAGFYHPPEKRETMIRNLRVAFGRAGLTDQEVRTLRGVVTALAKGRGRVLAKIAAAKAKAAEAEGEAS